MAKRVAVRAVVAPVDPKVVAAAKWQDVVNHIRTAAVGLSELSPSVAAWRHVERTISNLIRSADKIEKMGVASVKCDYSEHKAQSTARKAEKIAAKRARFEEMKAKAEKALAELNGQAK